MLLGGLNNQQVFINCPFDDPYKSLLRPLLFTLCYLGFSPRIASESLNSAENRIDKICALIQQTKLSVHDLSRCTSTTANEFFRLNMPFELGIDYGFSFFNHLNKKMLILEGERYHYQKTLSDLSGVDVKCHNNKPEEMVGCIRHWVVLIRRTQNEDSPSLIWSRFTDFTSDFYDDRKAHGFSDKDLNDMPTPEYIDAIKKWLLDNRVG